MKFSDIYSKNDKFNFSCEVFPPKIDFDKKKYSIKEELNKLSIYNPKLISVTCGAGGSGNHNNSLELVKFLLIIYVIKIKNLSIILISLMKVVMYH